MQCPSIRRALTDWCDPYRIFARLKLSCLRLSSTCIRIWASPENPHHCQSLPGTCAVTQQPHPLRRSRPPRMLQSARIKRQCHCTNRPPGALQWKSIHLQQLRECRPMHSLTRCRAHPAIGQSHSSSITQDAYAHLKLCSLSESSSCVNAAP